jgi:two-component system phosphate regulon sensor histidine kinase PhoR
MRGKIGVTAAICAAPLLSLGGLVASGYADGRAGAIAAGMIAAASFTLAHIWVGDASRLEDALHAAVGGKRDVVSDPSIISFIGGAHTEVESLAQTIETRREQVETLLLSEAAIVERLPDPLIVLGADRNLRRANAAARAVFGNEISSVLRHPALRAAIDRALAPGQQNAVQTAELSLPVPVAREILAMVVGLSTKLADGGTLLAVLADRTHERAVEKTRADFVANASHELRTPLASVIGFIATLRGPARDDSEAQARFLAIMAEQAERMNRVIDDLLSLSRIEISEHQPPSDHVDLADIVEGMMDAFEIRARERQIKMHFDNQAEGQLIIGDADQLEHVVQNLLDNAIKYGRGGGEVKVSLAAAPATVARPRAGLVLRVADDGSGIPKEHIPRLTERFYRVDAGRSRAIGGTGLGLAIVKHILNRHRGQLTIDSEPGKGSAFSVWLPLVEG